MSTEVEVLNAKVQKLYLACKAGFTLTSNDDGIVNSPFNGPLDVVAALDACNMAEWGKLPTTQDKLSVLHYLGTDRKVLKPDSGVDFECTVCYAMNIRSGAEIASIKAATLDVSKDKTSITYSNYLTQLESGIGYECPKCGQGKDWQTWNIHTSKLSGIVYTPEFYFLKGATAVLAAASGENVLMAAKVLTVMGKVLPTPKKTGNTGSGSIVKLGEQDGAIYLGLKLFGHEVLRLVVEQTDDNEPMATMEITNDTYLELGKVTLPTPPPEPEKSSNKDFSLLTHTILKWSPGELAIQTPTKRNPQNIWTIPIEKGEVKYDQFVVSGGISYLEKRRTEVASYLIGNTTAKKLKSLVGLHMSAAKKENAKKDAIADMAADTDDELTNMVDKITTPDEQIEKPVKPAVPDLRGRLKKKKIKKLPKAEKKAYEARVELWTAYDLAVLMYEEN